MKRIAIIGGLIIIVMLSARYPSNARADDVIYKRFSVNKEALAEVVLHHGFSVSNKANVLECQSCHDGSIARARFLDDHPVNMPYPPIYKRSKFKDSAMVKAAGIKLVHGLVTCVSCHNLANPKLPHLVIELDHSKLCFTCHIK
jgi:predicted CXXCH cytochrome family protein